MRGFRESPRKKGNMSNKSNNARPTVAVVAVHGDADQKQFETVRRIADLLLSQSDDRNRSVYTTFHEVPLRIPTRAMTVSCKSTSDSGGATVATATASDAMSFHELAQRPRAVGDGSEKSGLSSQEPVDIAFARQAFLGQPHPAPEQM